MAACCIFDEDEVCIPTSSGGFKYGMVVESSECVSSDDDSDPDESRVQRGQVKVAWHPSGTETVVAEDKVILTNRSLVPGDVVRRLITGEQSQRGFVQSVHTKCHVQVLGSKQYIYNVDAAEIKPMQEFDPEPEVTLDSWVGAIIEVIEEITVRFPCGARCKLENAGSLNLEDIHDKRDPHSEFTIRSFYPGQELAGSYDDYVDAIWLYSSNVRGPKMKVKSLYNATVVVEEVKTHSITVDWACKGFTRAGAGTDKLESPPDVIEGDDLKRVRRLDCFEYCHTQIGDKGFYIVKENDIVLHNISPRKHITPDILELQAKENVIVLGTSADGIVVKQRGVSERKSGNVNKTVSQETDNQENHQNGEIAVVNSDKNEEVVKDIVADDDDGDVADDEFQDVEDDASDSESDTASIPSGAGSPAPNRKVRKRPCLHGVHRLKGKRARKKAQRQREREVKPGLKVPVEIAYTYSTCDVMWQNGTLEPNVPSPELFPIHHLDELEFFPGDFVIDSKKNNSTEYGVIMSCDHKERTVMVKWVQPYSPGKANKPIEQEPVEMSVFDIKDHPDYKFRCESTVIRVGGYEGDTDVEAVGQVYKINPDGTILVWWPDKTITSCYPQDLYFIGDEFRSESGSESEEWTDVEEEEEEEDGSDVSWETENEETDDDNNESKHNNSKSSFIIGDDKRKELDGLLMRVQSAIWGLLMVFENTAVPYFKNSEQVFHDILAIFKRCKEFDKIIKSSFFDDQEVAELISNIKDELRKQKTGKLSRHVANIYKSRTQVCENNMLPGNEDSVKEVTEKCEVVDDDKEGDNVNVVKGAEGGITQDQKENTEMSDSKKALVEIMDTDDPLLQIILHTLLAQVASAKNDDKKSENSSNPSATGDFFKNLDNMKQRSMKEYVQSVIKSACENNDKELSAVIQNAKLKAKANISEEKDLDKETESIEKDENNVEVAKESGDGVEEVISNNKCSNEEEDKNNENVDDDQSDEKILQPNHRSLCIRVCKALNVRVMQIKQEVSRKWLANKMGCDDSVSNMELYEKLQEKMIESVESGNGHLRLVSEGIDVLNEMNEAKTTDVIEVNGETIHGVFTNGVHELESLVEGRASCESDAIENSVPDEIETVANGDVIEKGFEVCSETPSSHKFKYQEKKPSNTKSFMNAVRKEWNLLRTCLPDGIFVKVFEDRMDLMSVMIMGPLETPYEDGLFVFDIQLPSDYPESPPLFHYHSFCDERLNPNLYEDGKVCVSLLGTWTGKGNECWTNKSSVLQVLVSIQGLILVPEPYFNEAGYEKQRGSQHGQENSRMYNEMAVLKLVQSMAKMAVTPPCLFVEETKKHIINHAQRFIDRVEYWVEFSNKSRSMVPSLNEESQSSACNGNQSDCTEINSTDEICDTIINEASSIVTKENSMEPAFPLLPASKGFCLTVRKHLECLKEVLKEHIFINSLPDSK